jgi:hypothetical protein
MAIPTAMLPLPHAGGERTQQPNGVIWAAKWAQKGCAPRGCDLSFNLGQVPGNSWVAASSGVAAQGVVDGMGRLHRTGGATRGRVGLTVESPTVTHSHRNPGDLARAGRVRPDQAESRQQAGKSGKSGR